MSAGSRRWIAGASLLLALGLAACRTPGRPILWGRVPPLRISELQAEGDAARRASTRLVLQGLDADVAGSGATAAGHYHRALQVDPTNPYAYLALARHHAEGDTPERGLSFLERTRSLLEAEDALSPRVRAHLVGLRGVALDASGRMHDAVPLLVEASELAPRVWGDGHLSPAELR